MDTAIKSRWEQIEQRRHEGFVIVLERLYALKEDEDEAPTTTAFERTRDLIIYTNSLMQRDFPRGTASTEEDGGIRIEWRREQREVKLVTAPELGKLEYIYHEDGDARGLEKDLSPTLLARWLDWLTEG